MAPTSTLPEWLASAISSLQTGDVDRWMEIYASDAIHEFPFAREGAVRRLVGRDAIAAHLRHLPELIRFGDLSDIRVREAGDELIVEAAGHHRRVSDDAPREISYVWFFTLRNGQVTNVRDYMNPLQLATLF